MSIVMQYVDRFHEILDKNADSRTTNWFLMSSPFPTLFICLSYVYIVKVIGPKLMENRKPFQLKNVLIAYNLIQVIFSTWLFYESLMGGWWGHYSFRCQPVDYSNSPTAIRISMAGWLTGDYSLRCQPVDYSDRPQVLRVGVLQSLISNNYCKINIYIFTIQPRIMKNSHATVPSIFINIHQCNDIDLLFHRVHSIFQIFFVLRKKNNHVSTLHVIHHGCMPMSVWFGVKFTPGGHSTFFGLLNTFVHIIMYGYYLLAALGPQMQPYLWWKKYLTALQMIQFVAIMIHAFQLLFIECNYPKAFVWWIGLHAVMFFFLFNEFYKESYAHSKNSKSRAKSAAMAAVTAATGACMANGLPNSKQNGTEIKRRDAADYYVKGESIAASELHLRKPYSSAE
ncbi:elongation of very long chain fatty acids protein AAEL008004 [Fopius arisanus]|uniref:Elongation of very long chain fatty acids protein n=1 Tax=Fopius arisanus TaxID=64838 RepID=A0A9R1T3B9_9HYME|nr:PREDICTED: elongation of very long chain fatty acids protein AAEL008004-like [Fopius arisanus]